MEFTIAQKKEIGLKKEIARQSGLKKWEKEVKQESLCHLFSAWYCLYQNGINPEELVWNFFLDMPVEWRIKCDSKLVGEMSIIGLYENKKGLKSQAHFSVGGKYIGSVKQLGPEPVSYEGWFPILPNYFRFEPSKITKTTNKFSDFMVPINQIAREK